MKDWDAPLFFSTEQDTLFKLSLAIHSESGVETTIETVA
jgi:hypothetical protein